MRKEIGKRKEDVSSKAAVDQITQGDKVLVKNTIFPHKPTPNFGNTEYDVLSRNSNELTLFGNGKVIKRNVAHVKKIATNHIPTKSEAKYFDTR